MFSQKDFIDVSRDFVCVRLESYESREHQDMVRSFLGGRFANTAFCLLAPDGKQRLSRSGRSPSMGLGSGRPREDARQKQNESVLSSMKAVAKKYRRKGSDTQMIMQDFHTFRQALNVASGDQRLLVFVSGPEDKIVSLRQSLSPVFSDEDIAGRYHWDFAGAETDAEWSKSVNKTKPGTGVFIIRADAFGQKGKVLARLPLDADGDSIKAALNNANEQFSKQEKRKVYSQHVRDGRRNGVYFENGMPYGEDRDGDGKIDHRPRPRR